LAPSSGSRQGDCRDVVPTASVSGSVWDCDMGYVAFWKATCGFATGVYVAFLKATHPLSPSRSYGDRV
ncbi:hypothetical protein Taro_043279, partial [Colocasia esculenta]|nr:hypothetical protein [Colocasia esculenta]